MATVSPPSPSESNSLYNLLASLPPVLPVSIASRVFSFFYCPFGLVLLAVTVVLSRECLLESFEESYRSRRDKLATKARERKEERKRRQTEQRERRRRAAAEQQARALGEGEKEGGGAAVTVAEAVSRDPLVEAVAHPAPTSSFTSGVEARSGRRKTHAFPALSPHQQGGTLAALVISADAAAVPVLASSLSSGATSAIPASPISLSSSAPSSWTSRLRRQLPRSLPPLPFLGRRGSQDSTDSNDGQPAAGAAASSGEEEEGGGGSRLRRQNSSSTISSVDDSFRTLKTQLAKEQRQEFRLKLGMSISLFFVFWFVRAPFRSTSFFHSLDCERPMLTLSALMQAGSAVFIATEKWSYFDALWFRYVYVFSSCTTFGTLTSSLSRLSFVYFSTVRVYPPRRVLQRKI